MPPELSSTMLMEHEPLNLTAKFYPHDSQQTILNSPARFIIVNAGRRFGKSVLAVNRCIEKAIEIPNSKIWYCSPLYKQTKEIAWNLFNTYCPTELVLKSNEAELKKTFENGSEIALKGTDNPDSLVGVGLTYVVLDEYPLMKDDVWYHIVRPMLIDTKGECLFIGTPRGYNWAYDLLQQSKQDDDFESFQFKTVDNTAIEDIAIEVGKAKKEATTELDKIIFRQEYEASFEIITGRPRFDLEQLNKLYATKTEAIETDGLLNIYQKFDQTAKYVIGVDTSEGLITGDKSAAVILNARDNSIAAHYSGLLAPDVFASHLAIWGKKYNEALIVVESNNHGLVTINYLRDIYNHIFFKKHYDESSHVWTKKLGFQTNSLTKPWLISKLDEAIRSGLKIPVEPILDELRTYIIEEDGKTNASEGSHDDNVIALALAVQGHLELGTFNIPSPDEIPARKRNTVWAIEHEVDLKHEAVNV